MEYITTTQLRTQSSKLVEYLAKGQSISLVHRSRIVGEIKPKKQAKPLTDKDIQDLRRLADKLNLPKMPYPEREKKYKKQLLVRYGKDIPGH